MLTKTTAFAIHVLTLTLVTRVAGGTRARVAVDVVGTRTVYTRATVTLVDITYKKKAHFMKFVNCMSYELIEFLWIREC